MLFVRNLANSVTEEILEKAFSQFGKLERVKKLKDYAFIHFDERDGAVKVGLASPRALVMNKLQSLIREKCAFHVLRNLERITTCCL